MNHLNPEYDTARHELLAGVDDGAGIFENAMVIKMIEEIWSGRDLHEYADGALKAQAQFRVSGVTGFNPPSGLPNKGDSHPIIPELRADDRRVIDKRKGIIQVDYVQ